MLNTSSFYNLSNPGMDTDIGDAYFNMMYPNNQFLNQNDYIPGVTGTMDGITINGQLTQDTYGRGRKTKTSPVVKIIFGILAISALCLGGKLLKNGVVKLWEKVKGWFKFKKK